MRIGCNPNSKRNSVTTSQAARPKEVRTLSIGITYRCLGTKQG